MTKYQVAILTVSDRSARGQREDLSGPLIEKLMVQAGYNIYGLSIVPDEIDQIKDELNRLVEAKVDLILTTGGTGFGPRDVTPEATEEVCDRLTPGISELMRYHSGKYTKRAYLSRATSGIKAQTLIVNLPGSTKAVEENLEGILEVLGHGLDMLTGHDH